MKASASLTDTSNREIFSERLLNAPRELVYDVWTKPEHIIHWWGPNGFTNTIHEMDVKPGGQWRFIMHGPNGMDFPNKITFVEVVRPSKLVYLHGDDMPGGKYFHVTVTFEAVGRKTKLTMRMVFNTAEERNKVVKEYGAIEGNKQTLDKLEAYLAKMENKN